MQNFLISFEVVFPIFIMMALGFFLRRIKLFNDVTVKQMNAAVFRVFLPVMLFKNVYKSSISEVFNGRLLAFALIAAVACVAFAFLIVPLLTKENPKRGALIQGIFRSNFAIFGLPVAVTLCGETSAAVAAILIATVIPLYNVLAVVTLEVFGSKRGGFGKTVKGIAKNPLIIASLLGLVANLIGLKLPAFMETAVSNVGSIATPLSLVMLGASIHFSTVKRNAPLLTVGLLAKLVLIPGVCLSLAAFAFGFRGAELAVLIALFASPTAVSSFPMAVEMGSDEELAGQLVMFSTALSVLTVFFWILMAVSFGLV